ncbi:hypothetical protein FLB_20830 [Flavobacterium succinicans]|uniref:Uncharacterized protein n=1 Tax=Flavobacterium succinicans TaxID=29536 RepID=A0A199XPW5_9FLAO|nr:hypothetical protein FLB_20830 [Flavobacterium succinicans]
MASLAACASNRAASRLALSTGESKVLCFGWVLIGFAEGFVGASFGLIKAPSSSSSP